MESGIFPFIQIANKMTILFPNLLHRLADDHFESTLDVPNQIHEDRMYLTNSLDDIVMLQHFKKD